MFDIILSRGLYSYFKTIDVQLIGLIYLEGGYLVMKGSKKSCLGDHLVEFRWGEGIEMG